MSNRGNVSLIGPVEWWWDTPKDPERFNSPEARRYRSHREEVSDFWEVHDYLVYRHWGTFRGPWDPVMQAINNYAIKRSHFVVDMTPYGIPIGRGTAEELALARSLILPIFHIPPLDNMTTWEQLKIFREKTGMEKPPGRRSSIYYQRPPGNFFNVDFVE
jgi:hypothetical protein